MKVYDIVKIILLNDEGSRNSDKRLMWKVWQYQHINFDYYEEFVKRAAHPKSIIESRRILQRKQEEKILAGDYVLPSELLIASERVLELREKINQEKGTHIFRDEAKLF